MLNFSELDYALASPRALWLLLIIPAIIIFRSKLNPKTQKSRRFKITQIILYLSITLAILSFSRPQIKTIREMSPSSDIMFAIDISRSMKIRDFKTETENISRLDAVKLTFQAFMKQRLDARIGVLAYTESQYLLSPLTLSHRWLTGPDGIGRLKCSIEEDGTATGLAIASAALKLDNQVSQNKFIILITDGKNNAGRLNPSEASRLASTLGIKIYTIAINTEKRKFRSLGGKVLKIPLEYDESTLRNIAKIGNGKFFVAANLKDLESIFQEIYQLETAQRTPIIKTIVEEVYEWPATVAFILVFLALIGSVSFARK